MYWCGLDLEGEGRGNLIFRRDDKVGEGRFVAGLDGWSSRGERGVIVG